MLSSKEFDNKLQIDNFIELERAFQETKKYFETLSDKIKGDEVALKFPAYCEFEQFIIIKFPTYKIRIINNKLSHDEINKILKGSGYYNIYDECNVVTLPSLTPVKSTAIHCLENSLEENECTAEKIETKLKDNHIHTQRCVDFGYYSVPIKVDEEGYITVIKP